MGHMVTGARGWKPVWAGPGKINFQISKLYTNLQIQKGSISLLQKYSNFAFG
jgi:hypothetical protein